MLDTSTVSTGRALTHREVMDLPVIGNNIMMLTRMAPGVQVPGTTQFLVQGQVGGGSAYNRPAASAATNGRSTARPPTAPTGASRSCRAPTSIDEFKIETSNFDASFGHSTGLNISMSTKSGANAFHGTGTYQYFNQRWNAASFFVKQAALSADRRGARRRQHALADELAEHARWCRPDTRNNYHATRSAARSTFPKSSTAATSCSSSSATPS